MRKTNFRFSICFLRFVFFYWLWKNRCPHLRTNSLSRLMLIKFKEMLNFLYCLQNGFLYRSWKNQFMHANCKLVQNGTWKGTCEKDIWKLEKKTIVYKFRIPDFRIQRLNFKNVPFFIHLDENCFFAELSGMPVAWVVNWVISDMSCLELRLIAANRRNKHSRPAVRICDFLWRRQAVKNGSWRLLHFPFHLTQLLYALWYIFI